MYSISLKGTCFKQMMCSLVKKTGKVCLSSMAERPAWKMQNGLGASQVPAHFQSLSPRHGPHQGYGAGIGLGHVTYVIRVPEGMIEV